MAYLVKQSHRAAARHRAGPGRRVAAPRVRHRRRLLGHRRGQAPLPRGHPVRLLREGQRHRRAPGSTTTPTASRPATTPSRSTRRARGWRTPTSRCPRTTRPTPATTRSHAYFEQYVDHFGFRDTITFDTTVEDVSRGRRRPLGRADQRARRHRDPDLRRGAGRQRPPLGPALARAGLPGRLRRRADPRPRLPLRASSSRAATSSWSAPATPRWTSRSSRPSRARTTTWSVRRTEWVLRKFFLGKPSDQVALPAAGCRGG